MANQQDQPKEQTLSQEDSHQLEDVTGGGFHNFFTSCFKPRKQYEDAYAEQHYYIKEQNRKSKTVK